MMLGSWNVTITGATPTALRLTPWFVEPTIGDLIRPTQ
jgi:hypothetical protein